MLSKEKKLEMLKDLLKKKEEKLKDKCEKNRLADIILINNKAERLLEKGKRKLDQWYKKEEKKILGRKVQESLKPLSIKKCWEFYLYLLQTVVKIKELKGYDYGNCISCGKEFDKNSLQAGHYITRECRSLADNVDNIHIQCSGCNIGMSGKYGNKRLDLVKGWYRDSLIKSIGIEKVKALEIEYKKTISINKGYPITLSKFNNVVKEYNNLCCLLGKKIVSKKKIELFQLSIKSYLEKKDKDKNVMKKIKEKYKGG